ncbi:hypothetical protein N7499_000896 [Penicillium canescens]|uniref:Uncharacterized protein n=1 Tax=Penicillium canescens TaxID=5083 RepID=A0AAD6N473_PENCN|nr:uncharacterized protein N7446_004061 [Penicillium canescens]KAJ6009150.1 hypothetical protein N7522_004166 [Penicillium canescens]KAJ6027341.1 hypothetical protein N7460_012158 [Penicillium canescens]KAJ6040624.1 hypothetical protein N7444_009529 [Penicillium canescens]KAJ6067024.1 hypothetical protein N7446_004061 [Penicillium canescens]KAJ6101266.1 hypothetical protein N7499_000896 [Penicillium canescens]
MKDPIISERAIDEPRPLKVIYVGAGVSGILAAIQFPKHVPGIELAIYEKNPDLGGTWFENRYPGCACDIPAHSYQLSFESSVDWTSFYATAPEIFQYWQRVADKYNVRRFMTFRHRCIEARWNDVTSQWHVKFINLDTGLIIEDSADVLMSGVGALNQWEWPSIKGLHDFKGPLMHSANWDVAFQPKDKNVAVIGAGSSGIQIVPALLPEVKSMDHYVRGRTWIAASFGSQFVRERNNGNDGNFDYTEDEKRAWKEDPASYKMYRKTLEAGVQGVYPAVMKNSELQAAMRSQFDQDMRERLKAKPELAERIVPDFAPFCKRLTPGPGYLEALVSPKVNVIHDGIASVDETGIITEDGQHRPVDAIVCATGFRSFGGSFPLYGRGGLSLTEYNKDRPETYLAVCMDRFPNYFQTLGPNSGLGAGNLLMVLESVTLYVAQILRKLATGNVKTIEPKRKQVENFTRFCEAYHKRTVFTDKCASWYKSGTTVEERTSGIVIGVWPGSGVHLIKAYQDVRWEDFEMQPSDGNEFGWFGNGWSVGDLKKDTEALTWYLNDTRFVHEDLPESKED